MLYICTVAFDSCFFLLQITSMKTSFRTVCLIFAGLLTSITAGIVSDAQAQIRQTSLYIDDGSGNFTVLKSAPGGGTDTMPAGGGTVLLAAGTGTAGQVLTSSGSAAPSWQTGSVAAIPSGTVVGFTDNGTHSGYSYTGQSLD